MQSFSLDTSPLHQIRFEELCRNFGNYLININYQFKIGQARTQLLTKEEEINLLFSILHLGTSLTPELETHRLRMQRRRRSVTRPWYRRLWSAKRPVITKETEAYGKEKISFMEIIFVLIGQILD